MCSACACCPIALIGKRQGIDSLVIVTTFLDLLQLINRTQLSSFDEPEWLDVERKP